jgi:phosphate-selective porin OprO/OprP
MLLRKLGIIYLISLKQLWEINKRAMKKVILTLLLSTLIPGLSYSQSIANEVKYGGRIMYDMAVWGDSAMKNAGTEFRRVRVFNSGKLYGNVKYKLQLDFAGGEISFKDVWMELEELPFSGTLRVGHFKEPLRLEALTSSKYITFMERGLMASLSPERNTGAMYHSTFGNKLSLQSGVFREGDSFGDDKEATNNINITSRITYLAINNDRKLLHLGASNSIRKNNEKIYKISSRAENHLGTKLIDATFEDIDESNLLGGEFAYVNGSLSLQGEYLQTALSGVTETKLSSYYGQISYFLTGESRPYKSSLDGFGRVKPNNNYGNEGKGAIEVVARTSQICLEEADMGQLNARTIGLNWYLNPNTRLMINYVMGERTDLSGEVITENAAMMRVQLDF